VALVLQYINQGGAPFVVEHEEGRPVAVIDLDATATEILDVAINRQRRAEGLPPCAPAQSWAHKEYSEEERAYTLRCYDTPAFYDRLLPASPETPPSCASLPGPTPSST
jgi:hypothetical protein